MTSPIPLVKKVALLAANGFADMCGYLRHSATLNPGRRQASHQAVLTAHYHAVEKGLCLANGRVGFGVKHVELLLRELSDYCQKYGLDNVARVALKTLWEYHRYNAARGHVNAPLLNGLRELSGGTPERELQATDGGALLLSREDILRHAKVDFANFARARHSVRAFACEPVSPALLFQAIEVAQRTPSVCNRQAWKVHLFTKLADVQRVLSHQTGSRGFGDTAGAILIVTCDLSVFIGTRERNQAYIDGGMFAMSLVYALHSLGLGTCCLNLSQQFYEANRLRQAAGIPQNEVFIMMVAVGWLPEALPVTCSHRRPVSEVVTVH